MDIFEKWNNSIDTEGLAKDTKEAEQGNGQGRTYEDIPVGTYEVKIEQMELKESKNGDPMFSAWFRILQGKYENSILFMNAIITQGFQIGNVNKFLRSLEAVEEVEFENYVQYNNLIMDIKEAIDENSLEYLIEFKKNKKDFPVYTVKEVYES